MSTPVPAATLLKRTAAKEAAWLRMEAKRARETKSKTAERLRKNREHMAVTRAEESSSSTRSRQWAFRTQKAQTRAAETAEQTLGRQEN